MWPDRVSGGAPAVVPVDRHGRGGTVAARSNCGGILPFWVCTLNSHRGPLPRFIPEPRLLQSVGSLLLVACWAAR
jgi:hypothetical protein